MEFGKVQVVIATSCIIATAVVGVTLGWMEARLRALVAAWYIQSILQVAISYCLAPFRSRVGNPFKPISTEGWGGTLLTSSGWYGRPVQSAFGSASLRGIREVMRGPIMPVHVSWRYGPRNGIEGIADSRG